MTSPEAFPAWPCVLPAFPPPILFTHTLSSGLPQSWPCLLLPQRALCFLPSTPVPLTLRTAWKALAPGSFSLKVLPALSRRLVCHWICCSVGSTYTSETRGVYTKAVSWELCLCSPVLSRHAGEGAGLTLGQSTLVISERVGGEWSWRVIPEREGPALHGVQL